MSFRAVLQCFISLYTFVLSFFTCATIAEDRKKVPMAAHTTRSESPINVPAPRPPIPDPAIPSHYRQKSGQGSGGKRWSTRKSILVARFPRSIRRVPPPSLSLVPESCPLASTPLSTFSSGDRDPLALASPPGMSPISPPTSPPSPQTPSTESYPPTPDLSTISTISDCTDDSPPHTPITPFAEPPLAVSSPARIKRFKSEGDVFDDDNGGSLLRVHTFPLLPSPRPLSALLPDGSPFMRRVSSAISLLPSPIPSSSPALGHFDISQGDPFAVNEQSFFADADSSTNIYDLAVYAQHAPKSPEKLANRLPIWETWARLSNVEPMMELEIVEGNPQNTITAVEVVEKKSRAKERAQHRRAVLVRNGGGYTTPVRTARHTPISTSTATIIQGRPSSAHIPVEEACARADFLRSLSRIWFASAPIAAQAGVRSSTLPKGVGSAEPHSNTPHVETDARVIVRERYRRSKQIDELIELVDSHAERRSWDLDIELGADEEGDVEACVVDIEAM